ncbi:MAG: PorP/SprF family type IX secretion system membrane protein [Mucilaginibacter sp.]
MKKLVVLFCLTLCFVAARAQQDAQFSQYLFNGLYINPAYAGYKQDMYLNSAFRSQWTGLTGAPTTLSIAVDGTVADGKVGLGLMIQHDQIGAQSNLATYANYAYRIQIGEQENSRLAFGLGAGFVQNGIDGAKLNAVQANDNYIPTGFQSVILPDARLGVYYSNDRFFIGASADNLVAHLVHPATTSALLIPVPVVHTYFTTGALFDVDYETKFKPSILIKDAPGAPTSMDINAFILLKERLWLGGTYRTAIDIYNKPNLQTGMLKASAMVAMAEFFVTDTFRVGYSFDYSLSKLGSYGYGSHELSLSFTLKNNAYKDKTRNCYF